MQKSPTASNEESENIMIALAVSTKVCAKQQKRVYISKIVNICFKLHNNFIFILMMTTQFVMIETESKQFEHCVLIILKC